MFSIHNYYRRGHGYDSRQQNYRNFLCGLVYKENASVDLRQKGAGNFIKGSQDYQRTADSMEKEEAEGGGINSKMESMQYYENK